MAKESGAIRRFAAQLKHRVADADRNRALGRGLRQLAEIQSGEIPRDRILRNLTYGWGNEAWAAGSAYLKAVIHYVEATRDTIVECGSGLSTLVAGTLAKRQGRQLLALEHHPAWAERVGRNIRTHHLVNVQLSVCELRSYEAFDWYAIEDSQLPARVGLIICDGPPAQTKGGRYGALPVLNRHLSPGCVVLLDDAHRPEEQQIAKRWCAEFGLRLVEENETYSVLSYATAL